MTQIPLSPSARARLIQWTDALYGQNERALETVLSSNCDEETRQLRSVWFCFTVSLSTKQLPFVYVPLLTYKTGTRFSTVINLLTAGAPAQTPAQTPAPLSLDTLRILPFNRTWDDQFTGSLFYDVCHAACCQHEEDIRLLSLLRYIASHYPALVTEPSPRPEYSNPFGAMCYGHSVDLVNCFISEHLIQYPETVRFLIAEQGFDPRLPDMPWLAAQQSHDLHLVDVFYKELDIGHFVDVLDTRTRWLPAKIMNKRADAFYVHYLGWSNQWDEWIGQPSIHYRIAPLQSRWKSNAMSRPSSDLLGKVSLYDRLLSFLNDDALQVVDSAIAELDQRKTTILAVLADVVHLPSPVCRLTCGYIFHVFLSRAN